MHVYHDNNVFDHADFTFSPTRGNDTVILLGQNDILQHNILRWPISFDSKPNGAQTDKSPIHLFFPFFIIPIISSVTASTNTTEY